LKCVVKRLLQVIFLALSSIIPYALQKPKQILMEAVMIAKTICRNLEQEMACVNVKKVQTMHVRVLLVGMDIILKTPGPIVCVYKKIWTCKKIHVQQLTTPWN